MDKASGKDKYLNAIRNIGIIAHIDAGKTTLTERILYYAKRIHRLGEVHDGTATMDYMPEEQERGITITSACTSCHWRDKQINIIDTPGHVDFTIEVERSLRVLDGAVGVFCAVGGVEPQSETVWRQSEHYHVPKLALVNKMDRLGADFEGVIGEMRDKLHAKPLVLLIPEGSGSEFAGVIDLLGEKFLRFDTESHGAQVETLELSAEQQERAALWRDRLIENVAEEDEALLERYLSGERLTTEEIREAIRRATLGLKAVPVFVGSALKNIGVQPLMDGICEYLPSPFEVSRIEGSDPRTRKKKSFPVASQATLSALVFKVSVESGRLLALMRIYSGTLSAGGSVYNITQDETYRVARLFTLHAGHKERLDQAKAGQIVAAAGLKNVRTGDTLGDVKDPILLERISEYKPVISLALEPRNAPEEEKLLEALGKLLQEDPTLSMHRDEDTEQIILSGMGELHLEVVLERLKREYKVSLRSGRPQVVHRETIGRKARAEETFHKELGEEMHFGYLKLKVEPIARDRENQVLFDVEVDGWPKATIDRIYQALEDGLQSGVIRGFPVQGVRVHVLGLGEMREHSSEVGYHMAASGALKKALAAAEPLLMEPIMNLEVIVPEDFVGDVVSLIGTKGGKIENMYDRGGGKVIQALSPLSRLFGFSTELRSATQGRGNFMMRFDRFDVLEG